MRSVKSQNGDATQQRECRSGAGGNDSEEEDDGVGYELRVSVTDSRVAEKVWPAHPILPCTG